MAADADAIDGRKRRVRRGAFLLGAIGLALLSASVFADSEPGTTKQQSHGAGAQQAREPTRYPVHIRKPQAPPALDTGIRDAQGRPVLVSCQTCHATRTPDRTTRSADQLEDFHVGMRYVHGERTCLSCHNAENYDTLRLADGQALLYRDVMRLCAQCHGPQYRDYQHGSHGGMTGYWDLTRGPRTRNNCVDCHDPHAPRYPHFRPAPSPRDRFFKPRHEHGNGHDHRSSPTATRSH